MKLRKANLDDYEEFKVLFEGYDNPYQWMDFYNENEEDHGADPLDPEYLKALDFFDSIYIEEMDEVLHFNMEVFKASLKYDKVFMIIDKQKIIGTITLRPQMQWVYKIYQWGMYEQDYKQKEEVLRLILKKYKIWKLMALVFSTENKDFLVRNGFERQRDGSYCLQIEENNPEQSGE